MKLYFMHSKVDVNGKDAAPLYKFLKSSKGGLFGDNIKWNFSKFLVDKDGNVVDRYAPTTSPLSIEVTPIHGSTFIFILLNGSSGFRFLKFWFLLPLLQKDIKKLLGTA